MYTPHMHEEMKRIADKYYGFQLLHEDGIPLGRIFTFSGVLELIKRIEELEKENDKLYSEIEQQ